MLTSIMQMLIIFLAVGGGGGGGGEGRERQTRINNFLRKAITNTKYD